MDTITLILIIIFLLLSIILMSVSRSISKKIKKNCSLEIEAIVEKYSQHYSYTKNHRYRLPLYGFDYCGNHYITEAKTRFVGETEIGKKQKLIIDPHNPQDNYRKDDLILPRCLLILGIYFFFLSFYILLSTL